MNDKKIENIRGMVRPALTIIFGIAFIAATFARLIEPIWLAYLTAGVFVFWFGDRAFKNLGFMLKGQFPMAAPPAIETTEPELHQEARTIERAEPPVEEEVQPVEPFDAAAFHEAVLRDVGPRYTEVNPCTIFYEARDKGMATRADHISQSLDYWSYLVDLGQEAFRHIWGYTLEEAVDKVDEPGCPSCPTCPQGCGSHLDIDSKARHAGTAYYAILLELRRALRKQQELYQLAHSGIDWKSRLGRQHQTLYYLGELAGEIMRTA